jgi:hypothetical protein
LFFFCCDSVSAQHRPVMAHARHRPKHSATYLPPAGPPEDHAEIFAAGDDGKNMRQCWSARRKDTVVDKTSS